MFGLCPAFFVLRIITKRLKAKKANEMDECEEIPPPENPDLAQPEAPMPPDQGAEVPAHMDTAGMGTPLSEVLTDIPGLPGR